MSSLNLLEKSESFIFLKNYYEEDDFASRYGVSRLEIKHSNFLSWIFNYEKNKFGDYAIKKLLEYVVNKSEGKYNELKKIIKFNSYEIEDIQVLRETFNIDILIQFKINDISVNIVIENKINADISKNDKKISQLQKYREIITKVKDNYKSVVNIFLLLYPQFNTKLEKEDKDKFESITYQELYENVLFKTVNYISNKEMQEAINDYIHCLSTPINNTDSMIITFKEKKEIKKLIKNFKDTLKEIAESRKSEDKIGNEFYEFLEKTDYKNLFAIIYGKCMDSEDKELKEFEEIFKDVFGSRKNNNYFKNLDDEEYNQLPNSEFVYKVIIDIIKTKKIKTYDDFPIEIIDSTNQKLIIPENNTEIKRKGIYRLRKNEDDEFITLNNIRYYYLYNVLADEIKRLKKAIIKKYPDYRDRLIKYRK